MTEPTTAELVDLVRDNIQRFTDDEWRGLNEDIVSPEFDRRRSVRETPTKVSTDIRAFQTAAGKTKEPGATYVEPDFVMDTYNTGDIIREDDHVFECKLPGVLWPPSKQPDSWRELTADEVRERGIEVPAPPGD